MKLYTFNMLIENKYELIEKIGEGNFGNIYLAKNQNTEVDVAIKLEMSETPLLKYEARIYTLLREIPHIPKMRSCGKQGSYYYMVLDLYELSLKDKVSNYGKVPLNEVLHWGKQILNTLEMIHDIGIVHRDIKPENFMFINNRAMSDVYLIDFGLAKYYIDEEEKKNQKILGTLDYISVNVHNGLSSSRRDDIEALAYVMIFLSMGQLPWFNQPQDTKLKMKREVVNVEHNNVSREIFEFLLYSRNLGHRERPDYNLLNNILTI